MLDKRNNFIIEKCGDLAFNYEPHKKYKKFLEVFQSVEVKYNNCYED